MARTDKHIFAIAIDKNGYPRGVARVDTIEELAEVIAANDAFKTETRVRRMNLDQLSRVVERIMEPPQ